VSGAGRVPVRQAPRWIVDQSPLSAIRCLGGFPPPWRWSDLVRKSQAFQRRSTLMNGKGTRDQSRLGGFFSHGNRAWLRNENPRRQCVCCDGGGDCSPHAPTGHRRDEVRHTERRISRGKPITAAPNSGRRNLHKVASRRDIRGLPIPFLLA